MWKVSLHWGVAKSYTFWLYYPEQKKRMTMRTNSYEMLIVQISDDESWSRWWLTVKMWIMKKIMTGCEICDRLRIHACSSKISFHQIDKIRNTSSTRKSRCSSVKNNRDATAAKFIILRRSRCHYLRWSRCQYSQLCVEIDEKSYRDRIDDEFEKKENREDRRLSSAFVSSLFLEKSVNMIFSQEVLYIQSDAFISSFFQAFLSHSFISTHIDLRRPLVIPHIRRSLVILTKS
jgi:hypothetical protein